MGWKSTRDLTRKDAVARYADFKMQLDRVRQRYEAEAHLLTDRELGDELDGLVDQVHAIDGDTHGLYGHNFIVKED